MFVLVITEKKKKKILVVTKEEIKDLEDMTYEQFWIHCSAKENKREKGSWSNYCDST